MSGRGGRGRGRGRGGRGGRGPQSVSQLYLQNSALEAGVDVRLIRGSSTVRIFPELELHSSGERRLKAQEIETLRNGKESSTIGNDELVSGVKAEPGGTSAAGAPSAAASKSGTTAPEKPRSAETIYLISKAREMHHAFQSSVFYVRSTKEVPDVVRYSDKLRPPPNIDASAVLSHCLGGKKRTFGDGGGVFVPEELCGGQRRVTGLSAMEEEKSKRAKGLNLAALARRIKNDGGMDNEDGDEEGDEEFGNREEDQEESDGEDYVQNYYESEGEESKGSDGEPTF